jgi:hypothetical protein
VIKVQGAMFHMKQCCGFGSRIWYFFDPWIREEKKSVIRYPGSYFQESSNNFWVIRLKFFVAVPDTRSCSTFIDGVIGGKYGKREIKSYNV